MNMTLPAISANNTIIEIEMIVNASSATALSTKEGPFINLQALNKMPAEIKIVVILSNILTKDYLQIFF